MLTKYEAELNAVLRFLVWRVSILNPLPAKNKQFSFLAVIDFIVH